MKAAETATQGFGTDRQAPGGFVPLAQFEPPAVPRDEWLRQISARLLVLLKRETPQPFIADDRLTRTTAELLDDAVAPPACGPLLREIDETVASWRQEVAKGRRERRLVVVLPPCDGNHVVETWARGEGHEVLACPPRESLVSLAASPDIDRAGEHLLVVPRLERWFLRHRNGLRHVRALLAAVEAREGPVILGCNSWAWRYLSCAVKADALLPDPMTFRAFDAGRLHDWLSELSSDEATRGFRFRLPDSGEDALARNPDGTFPGDFFPKLAGRSRGIPWVAWHLWRRSLRSKQDETSAARDAGEVASGGDDVSHQTLWVAALDEYVLPGAHERDALTVLHALLLHGGLSVDELRLVLPTVGESNIMPVLAKAGFVERSEGSFRVRPAAYPAVRDGLAAAGFPTDGM